MATEKKKGFSLKTAFVIYFILCFGVAAAGVFALDKGADMLIKFYEEKYLAAAENDTLYNIILHCRAVLYPLWTLICAAVTSGIYFRREIKPQLDILNEAARRISCGDLNFTIECDSKNELGQLCDTVEQMRDSLYDSGAEINRSIEERKRLNAAFSQDLRNPLTVLRGYAEMLDKYSPDGRLTKDKQKEIIRFMRSHISRLEHYTRNMNEAHRADDIIPDIKEINCFDLEKALDEKGKQLCGRKIFTVDITHTSDHVLGDESLIMQVFENLVTNAARYAAAKVTADITADSRSIEMTICDDGIGFSDKVLKSIAEPFTQEDGEQEKNHFGLGLYICRIICEKCGGTLTVGNGEKGGKVVARFIVNNE